MAVERYESVNNVCHWMFVVSMEGDDVACPSQSRLRNGVLDNILTLFQSANGSSYMDG